MKYKNPLVLTVALVAAGSFWMLQDPGLYPEKIVMQVTAPNGGETFTRGQQNTINWKGGSQIVALGLVKPEASNEFDPTSLGYILGWINTKDGNGSHQPDGSYAWDGVQVCKLSFSLDPDTGCTKVQPGKYKIIAWSENAQRSMYIATGRGAHFKYPPKADRGNWDVSDLPFTIK